MDFHAAEILSIAVLLIHGRCTFCQTLTGPTEVAIGENAVFVCTISGVASPTFLWNDVSTGETVFTGGVEVSTFPKYNNFREQTNGGTSTMTITGAEIGTSLGDDGEYLCLVAGEGSTDSVTLVVEVGSTRTLSISAPCIAGESCVAQCDAVGGKPQENMTWYLNNNEEKEGVNTTNPTNPDPDLTNTRSVFTFTASAENNGQELQCRIGGHAVTSLNGAVTETLNVHFSPDADAIEVTFDRGTLDVTCSVINEANPSISNFYIYQNNNLIHADTNSDNTVRLNESPQNVTTFMCVAGNYLGNDTATLEYDPQSTTVPPTTPGITEPGTTSPPTETTGGANIAGIVGGVVGALAGITVMIIIVVLVNKGYCTCGGSEGSSNNPNKVSNEKQSENKSRPEVDEHVETMNELTTESAPTAAPRNIEHTTDNPAGDEYAMVSKKPQVVGDHKDGGQNGQGQTDGLHYADLDLTAKAGHTDQKVPQNQNDVVVYSSILV